MTENALNTFQQVPHPILPVATADELSRQEFVKSFKSYIQSDILPGLKLSYDVRSAPAYAKENGELPQDRWAVRKAMKLDPYFQGYVSLQRTSQELMWRSVIESVDRQLPELIEKVDQIESVGGTLDLDPDFVVPHYVTALDIHCMPGGYAGVVTENDVAAGAVYDRGVYLYAMGYMGPFNDDMGRSVCNYISRKFPNFKPEKIVDLGCTVGHSTLPFAEMFPDAEVHGVDVGEATLRYAHARAEGMGLKAHFTQQDAASMNYEDNSFDLVVSHILLHETSGKAIRDVFKECYRILKPGGFMIHADLPPFGDMDAYQQFILDNETYYNNEPFWGAMRDLDQVELSVDAGFERDSIYFDTAPMAIMEFAMADESYSEEKAKELSEREFEAGEYAPGGGWEVLVARK